MHHDPIIDLTPDGDGLAGGGTVPPSRRSDGPGPGGIGQRFSGGDGPGMGGSLVAAGARPSLRASLASAADGPPIGGTIA